MGACTAGLRGCCGHDGRVGEYEFADVNGETSCRLSITNKKANNELLVKHIRSTVTAKDSVALAPDFKTKQRQLQEALYYAPILKLKVLSGNLPPGKTIFINAQGAEQGLRGTKDGFTYFGCKKRGGGKPGIRARKGEIVNDIVIKPKDKDMAQRHRGRHFQIQYCVDDNMYKIKDLGIGYGAYVRLDNPLLLKDNYLLSMGESFFIVNLIQDNCVDRRTSRVEGETTINKKLRIKVFSGPSNGEILYVFVKKINEKCSYFSPCKQTIKVGRFNMCEIQIEDHLLSKYQAHIYYSEEKGWVITDGLGGKPSTNGTWLYLSEEYAIYDGMVFKADQTLFQTVVE